VYKKGAPIPNPDDPNEVIGEGPPRVLAEARLTAVRGGTSDAALLEAEEPPGIEVGHFFVTK
jgi:hypothetical protein